MMHSCIYEGRVWHHRMTPVDHRFKYRLYMAYLDLDDLPQLTGPRGLISKRRLATASFRRADHLHGTSGDLQTDLRQLILERAGVTVQGPIRLLTQLRYFGYFFSPLNLYYCFDSAGEAVQAIVAEVNNTPWREQHCYVLWEGNQTPGKAHLRYVHRKEFHVSPFMEMDYDYRWRLSVPGDSAVRAIAERAWRRNVLRGGHDPRTTAADPRATHTTVLSFPDDDRPDCRSDPLASLEIMVEEMSVLLASEKAAGVTQPIGDNA
jgi:DUF1365 family protein